MGAFRRLAAILGTAATLCTLSALPLAPTALAEPSTVITIGNLSSYEYLPTCSNTAPYPCGPTALSLSFRVYTSHIYNHAITVGWQISGGTATPGVDFTGPTSGTVTIAANTVNHEVLIPLVYDGVGEPTETFTVHATSASVPADLSSVGTETILDGSRIPADCSLGKTAPGQESMTCTNRPAGQRWYLDTDCIYAWGDPDLRGNDVIGNGTSAGTCSIGKTNIYGATFNTY
jgi:hypothetical protein